MSPLRLLLVEPNDDLVDLTSELLRGAGIETTGAATIASACKQLQQAAFDVIVTELFVEARQRERAWQDIRQLRTFAALSPIILMTGVPVAPEELSANSIAAGLLKPTGAEALLNAIAVCTRAPSLPAGRETTVRSYFASLEHSDWEQLASLCTEDVVYRCPGDDPRFSCDVCGREPFRELAAKTFSEFAEPRFAVTSMRALPVGAIVHYNGSWLDGERKRVSMPGSIFMRFEQTLIAEIGVRVDLRQLQQLAR